MILIILKLILLCSIWVLGVQIGTSEGMVFYRFRQYAETKKSKIWEAIVLCPWCCPSLHSIVAYSAALGLGIIKLEWQLLIMLPFVIAGSSLVCGLTWQIHKLIEIKDKYYTHLEQQEFYNLKERKSKYHNSKNKP